MNNNIMAMLQMLQQNPMQILARRGWNIPQNMLSDPNAIVQHLLSTGQITQAQYNQANSMARQMMPNNKM